MSDTLTKVLGFLKGIEETKGSKAKMALLAEASSLDKKVIQYALDPYRMYGVKSFTLTSPYPVNYPERAEEELFRTLDALVRREVTGNAAKEECEFLCGKYCVSSLLLSRILNKDLRIGLGPDSINKVFPKLIPEFKVALAKEYEEEEDRKRFGSYKYDGLRCIALVSAEGVELKTRNGLPIASAEHIREALRAYAPPTSDRFYELALDGEILVESAHFQDTSGAVRKKSEQATGAVFKIFDCLPLGHFLQKKSMQSQKERLHFLQQWLSKAEGEPFSYIAHELLETNAQVQAMYERARAAGYEGLVVKDPDAPYSFTRNSAWLKIKDVKTADVRVTGTEEGKGKYKGKLGALLVDFEGRSNSVGTGISDKERELWHNNPDLIVGKMVEVAYHEKTKDGNMRHSRLIKLRPDLE